MRIGHQASIPYQKLIHFARDQREGNENCLEGNMSRNVSFALVVIALMAIVIAGIMFGPNMWTQFRYGDEASVSQEQALAKDFDLPVSELFARAQDYLAKGDPDSALAVLEESARRGHAPSARAVGEMYDPTLWGETPSPFTRPNPQEALRWYEKAIELGDSEAANKANIVRTMLAAGQ